MLWLRRYERLLIETKSPSNDTWLTSALSWRRWSCEMNQPYSLRTTLISLQLSFLAKPVDLIIRKRLDSICHFHSLVELNNHLSTIQPFSVCGISSGVMFTCRVTSLITCPIPAVYQRIFNQLIQILYWLVGSDLATSILAKTVWFYCKRLQVTMPQNLCIVSRPLCNEQTPAEVIWLPLVNLNYQLTSRNVMKKWWNVIVVLVVALLLRPL